MNEFVKEKSNERLWIKQPLAVFNGTHPTTESAGGLVVENGLIVELVADGATPVRSVTNTFDASSMIVTPGLINTHHHFYQTLTRCNRNALNKSLFGWLSALYPIWANLDRDMVQVASELAIAELMLSGCTTVSDHHYLFSRAISDAIDIEIQTAQSMGVRAVITRGSMNLGRLSGGLPPEEVVQSHDDILQDSERLISRYHDSEAGAMTQVALAPCSPFSVTPELLSDTALMAEKYDVLLHTHLAETTDEEEFCQQTFGCRPLEHLQRAGWSGARSWFAHGIHFTPEEIRELGREGFGVCHCPTSNMLLASGVCKVVDLEKAGVRVGIGVDGSSSNDSSNMVGEVRQALLLQRLGSGMSTSHLDALRWATRGGANLLRRQDIGRISVGACADLAFFKLDDLSSSGCDDPLAGVVLSGIRHVESLMIAGKWRVVSGELIDVDLPSLMVRHRKAAARLNEALI